MVLFKSGQRLLGLFVLVGGFALFGMGAGGSSDKAAQAEGWADADTKRDAEKEGVTDPTIWAQRVAERASQEAAAKAEAEKQARLYAHQCLSVFSGQHREFVKLVTAALRDPDSFEHIQTRTGLADSDGWHPISMDYRAKNGFGGFTVGTATGAILGETCAVRVISIE